MKRICLCFAVLAVVVTVTVTCEGPSYYSESINGKDLAGRYYANFGLKEQNYLDLLADGTFIHFYASVNGTVYEDTGRWSFVRYRDREYAIDLSNLIRRHPQKGGCYYAGPLAATDIRPVNARFPLYRTGDTYVITYCFSQGQAFVKKPSGL